MGLSEHSPVSTPFSLVTAITQKAQTGGRGGECLLSARLELLLLKASLGGALTLVLESAIKGGFVGGRGGMSQADVRAARPPPPPCGQVTFRPLRKLGGLQTRMRDSLGSSKMSAVSPLVAFDCTAQLGTPDGNTCQSAARVGRVGMWAVSDSQGRTLAVQMEGRGLSVRSPLSPPGTDLGCTALKISSAQRHHRGEEMGRASVVSCPFA
ncbi:hypothetical protein GJAV_G00051660 [Gymnothorax javanicus]|nr:hypothetical protein GJAV_G00051660 [Gymnothorax javanicus]